MFWNLVLGAVFSFLSVLFQKQPKGPKPADEIGGIPEPKDGEPLLFVRGTAWNTGAQVAWWGDMDSKKIKSSSGKK